MPSAAVLYRAFICLISQAPLAGDLGALSAAARCKIRSRALLFFLLFVMNMRGADAGVSRRDGREASDADPAGGRGRADELRAFRPGVPRVCGALVDALIEQR